MTQRNFQHVGRFDLKDASFDRERKRKRGNEVDCDIVGRRPMNFSQMFIAIRDPVEVNTLRAPVRYAVN